MAVAMIELDDERHYNRQGPIGVGNCGMRVSKHQAAENREQILLAASRLLRERGVSGAGVDALSDAAGMTHGSLYSQFGSKERLVQEALTHALTAKELEARESGLSKAMWPSIFRGGTATRRSEGVQSRPYAARCHTRAPVYATGSPPVCEAWSRTSAAEWIPY